MVGSTSSLVVNTGTVYRFTGNAEKVETLSTAFKDSYPPDSQPYLTSSESGADTFVITGALGQELSQLHRVAEANKIEIQKENSPYSRTGDLAFLEQLEPKALNVVV
jgi:hypothetical protein